MVERCATVTLRMFFQPSYTTSLVFPLATGLYEGSETLSECLTSPSSLRWKFWKEVSFLICFGCKMWYENDYQVFLNLNLPIKWHQNHHSWQLWWMINFQCAYADLQYRSCQLTSPAPQSDWWVVGTLTFFICKYFMETFGCILYKTF